MPLSWNEIRNRAIQFAHFGVWIWDFRASLRCLLQSLESALLTGGGTEVRALFVRYRVLS